MLFILYFIGFMCLSLFIVNEITKMKVHLSDVIEHDKEVLDSTREIIEFCGEIIKENDELLADMKHVLDDKYQVKKGE